MSLQAAATHFPLFHMSIYLSDIHFFYHLLCLPSPCVPIMPFKDSHLFHSISIINLSLTVAVFDFCHCAKVYGMLKHCTNHNKITCLCKAVPLLCATSASLASATHKVQQQTHHNLWLLNYCALAN